MDTRRLWKEYWRLCRVFDRLCHSPYYAGLTADMLAVDMASRVVSRALFGGVA